MSYQHRKMHHQISAEELERLVYYMPTVATRATNGWAADFARSIKRQADRPGWHPSTKQLSIMRDLVADLFIHHGNEGGDIDVIE